MKSLVIIPTYNEIENIEAIIRAVMAQKKAFHILVVDDNSPDLTALKVKELQKEFAPDTNSIAVLVNHLSGNMLSRWTNFLTEDGEKEWRHRDQEFEDTYKTKEDLIENWDKGWKCLFTALKSITDNFPLYSAIQSTRPATPYSSL